MVKLDVNTDTILQKTGPSGPLQWRTSPNRVGYQEALDWMEARVAAIRDGKVGECVWLLEHPPIYTGGTSANSADLIQPDRFPVIRTGRGGQFTYHGPGQRVAYVMLDLTRRGRDVRSFVCSLEGWIIDTLALFDIQCERREGRVGVWVVRDIDGAPREDKIAAVGVRVRRWVTFHGISLNVSPELSHYDGIVPCGVKDFGVTSLQDLGVTASMEDVDRALVETFARHFNTG